MNAQNSELLVIRQWQQKQKKGASSASNSTVRPILGKQTSEVTYHVVTVISFPMSSDSTTVALQISVIHEHTKWLFPSHIHPYSCTCQHLERDITLHAWLAASPKIAG